MKIKFLTLLAIILITACDKSAPISYQAYIEGENIYLSSPYSGILIKKCVQRGQAVKQGDILFQLDKNPETLIIQQHEAELTQAMRVLTDLQQPRRPEEIKAIEEQIAQTEAQLQLAHLRVNRFQELRSKGAVDQDTLDAAIARMRELDKTKAQYQSNLELAKKGSRTQQIAAQEFSIQGLKKLVEQSKWQLEQKTIRAPADGIVFDTYFQEGEFVPSSRPIATLLPYKSLWLEFFVPGNLANQLKTGQIVSFSCFNCDKQDNATISYISPEAEFIPPLVYSEANSNKLVFRVRARIESTSAYKPGQPVIAVIHNEKR